jgi:hypothetical protein
VPVSLFVALAILVVLSIPLVIAIARANEVVCLDVVAGKIEVRRGRIPQRMLNDLADVTRRPKIERAVLRIVSEAGRPRLIFTSGEVGETQQQQLRNVVGMYRLAEIKNAPRR